MNMDHFNAWIGNALSLSAIAGTLLGYFPAIAAVVALIWYLIQISESDTVQRYLMNRRRRKLARLKARLLLLEAKPPPPPGLDT